MFHHIVALIEIEPAWAHIKQEEWWCGSTTQQYAKVYKKCAINSNTTKAAVVVIVAVYILLLTEIDRTSIYLYRIGVDPPVIHSLLRSAQ
jgi:hypothetical protein